MQNAPRDTETIGVTYNRGSWNVGLFSKRVGQMFNDNGSIHQAIPIDPFNITNLFFNYTLQGSSRLSQLKDPAGDEQPDRQPRDHRRQRGVDEVECAGGR